MTQTKFNDKATPARVSIWRGIPLRSLWMTFGLLAVGLILTTLAALYVKTEVEAAEQREFDFICNEIQLNIADRLDDSAQLLYSGAAFFDSSETVTRAEWRAFTERLQIEQQLPGIQGIGFAALIPPEQLEQHIAEIRREGFSDYEVRPAGERELYSSIVYLEPFSGRNLRAFGYDMFSEPVRRAAMEKARDENIAVLSGKVILVQETEQNVQAGALMYVPVYRRGLPIETVEQRRAAIIGWVYSPYRMTDMMKGTLGNWEEKQADRHINLQVYDGDVLSTESMLYDSQSAEEQALSSNIMLTKQTSVDFAGHRWTLRFTQLGGLASTADYGSVWLVVFGGNIISVLLFWLTLSLLGSRANAQQIANQLTTEMSENEENLRILFETMSEGVALNEIVYDENGEMVDYRILNVNRAFYATADYRGSDVVGNVATKLYGMSPEFIKDFWKQHKEKNATAYTEMYSPLDNHCFFVTTSPFSNDRFVTSFFDITERKQAEEALRVSEERFRSLASSFNDIIYTLDTQQRHTGVYGDWVEKAGLTPEFFLGKTTRDIFGAEAARAHEEANQQALAGTSTSYEWSAPSAAGILYYQTVASPLRNSQGEIIGIVGAGRDITKRKQAEDKLRESEDRYRRLVENAPDIVYTFSNQRGGIYYSPRVEQVLGYSAEYLYAHPMLWNESIHPEDRPRIAEILRDFEVGKSFDIEYRIQDAHGNWLWLRDRSIGRDVGGEVLVEGLATDITERKQTEEEIKRLNATLEQRVEERTQELRDAQEQLVRHEKLAALGQMAGGVGHELRNPLGVISNAVYFLKMSQPDADEKIKEYLGIIEKQVYLSSKIVGDLLDFTRVKSAERELISLPDLIRQTLERFPAPDSVQVALDLPADLPKAYADPLQLTQILGNFAINAYQAMTVPNASKSNKLVISARAQGDMMICVSVQDSGVGISSENIKKIFEPLFTTKPKGIGLGLAVSKKLTEANGGRIEVQSEVGQGSIFSLYLPVGQ